MVVVVVLGVEDGGEGGRTAMLKRPGTSCLRVKFSSAKALVP